MAEFSPDFPNFSISHNLFSNSSANERFPTLPEEELANLRSKNQNQNTSKGKKPWLTVFNEWKVHRINEAIPRHELDAIPSREKNSKKRP